MNNSVSTQGKTPITHAGGELTEIVEALQAVVRKGLPLHPDRTPNGLVEAAVGALWYLARSLTKLRRYIERYGKGILHGSAEYNVESLVRLAGWTRELTTKQVRDLRFKLAQVGEWDREGFAEVIRRGVD